MRRIMKLGFRKIITLAVIILAITLPASYFGYNYLCKSEWLGFKPTYITTPPKEIKGKIITLKELKEEYFLDFHNMWSVAIRKPMEFPETITLNYTIRYLKLEMEKCREGKQLMYCIFDNKDNKLIGSIEIREKNPDDPGQFTWMLNEHYRGGGRAMEACKLIADAYFKLHLDRDSFSAHVKLWNKRSYYALKKAGFKEIGYFYEDGVPTRHVMEYYRNK